MTDGHRKRVGGILARRLGEAEHRAHHALYLFLARPARAGDRELDLARRVFLDVHARPRGRKKRYAPGMTEQKRTPRVLRHEDVLNGNGVGPMFLDEPLELFVDMQEPGVKGERGPWGDVTVVDVSDAPAALLENAVTCDVAARVYADDSHSMKRIS